MTDKKEPIIGISYVNFEECLNIDATKSGLDKIIIQSERKNANNVVANFYRLATSRGWAQSIIEYRKMKEDLDATNEQIKKYKQTLESLAKDCPDCDNVGWYAIGDSTGFEQCQCEFCYTEPLSRFNLLIK